MKPVTRDDIVDYHTYEDDRQAFRRQVMAAKESGRIHVSDFFTFLFENPLTIRYQVQQMMRT